MLTLTEQAVEAVRKILAESDAGANGGLRISSSTESDGEEAFEFDVASEPVEGDEIVRDGGATVFLDRTAADALADKTLDVHAHGDHFHFSLEASS
jgi:Fe-S cluster assembly iron-binding protein IscA